MTRRFLHNPQTVRHIAPKALTGSNDEPTRVDPDCATTRAFPALPSVVARAGSLERRRVLSECRKGGELVMGCGGMRAVVVAPISVEGK